MRQRTSTASHCVNGPGRSAQQQPAADEAGDEGERQRHLEQLQRKHGGILTMPTWGFLVRETDGGGRILWCFPRASSVAPTGGTVDVLTIDYYREHPAAEVARRVNYFCRQRPRPGSLPGTSGRTFPPEHAQMAIPGRRCELGHVTEPHPAVLQFVAPAKTEQAATTARITAPGQEQRKQSARTGVSPGVPTDSSKDRRPDRSHPAIPEAVELLEECC
jgi:hypothetical protein